MSTALTVGRREFLQATGSGILVLLADAVLPGAAAQPAANYPLDPNAYLLVGADGRVTVYSGKIEMGQGVMTSQAQMAADELGVDLAVIDIVLGDTDRCPPDMGTFGSLTTRMFGPALRAGAAKARSILLGLASQQLGAAIDELVVAHGVVSVRTDPSRHASYGELARGRRLEPSPAPTPALLSVGDFGLMGQSPVRLDGHDKVTGAARYTADLRLPGMLYARIVRPPVHGATLQSVDTSAAAAIPGVRVVRRDDLVAVLHADPDVAATALARISAQWHLPPPSLLDADSIYAHLRDAAPAPRDVLVRGRIDPSPDARGARLGSTFHKGYVAHAPIEPHAALADVRADSATVWASTQTPFPTRDRIAAALGMEASSVRVIVPYVGGGFGGKSADRQAVEAARLSQQCAAPVQVAWTREEEFFYDTYDPACVVQVTSSLDATGRIDSWDYAVTAAGERGAIPPYEFTNLRVRAAGGTRYGPAVAGDPLHPFATGPWRGPGANMNVYAIESQMNRMAALAGADPVEFRLRHARDPRVLAVLKAAAQAFGWQSAPCPSGRGVGVAVSIDAGTVVATMAQVRVDPRSGRIDVERIVCAQDMGVVVNPNGARMQIEGGLMMGLGYTLAEEQHFNGGDIHDRNFDRYPLPTFSWAPRIETVLVRNDALAPQGGGEPATTTTGAVIAGAVFDAIGVPIYRLPMTPARVLQALALRAGSP